MEKIIEYLIGQLKEQYVWRAEESECGVGEINAGWCLKEADLRSEIQKITTSNSDYAKCQELLQIIKNSEAIKATPAVALFVVKEKLEKHFAESQTLYNIFGGNYV